jgi:hypothetical protein
MPERILVDLNVVLDVFLARPGFEAARDVIQLGEQHGCQIYFSAHGVTTMAYLLEHAGVPRCVARICTSAAAGALRLRP